MLFPMRHHLMQKAQGQEGGNTEFLPIFWALQMQFNANNSGSPVVDLQQCYELGLAVKVAKGIAFAACPSSLYAWNVWIAVHQGKSIVFVHALLH